MAVADKFLQPTLDVTEDEWERVFTVNVKSIYLSVKEFMPRMIEQGQGASMINVSSIGATRPRPGLVWYNSSKGAVTNVSSPRNSCSSTFALPSPMQ